MENGNKRHLLMRSVLVAILVAIITAVCTGCATPQKAERASIMPYTPRFVYAVATGGEKATGISISLVTPSWTVKQSMPSVSPMPMMPGMPMMPAVPSPAGDALNNLFAKSLGTDLEKLLTDRGFTFSGPFASLDEMTFPQKKQTDLVLTPEIAIELSQPPITNQPKMEVGFGGTRAVNLFQATGACTATGFVAFKVVEPLSNQKLWLKKVEVPQVAENCSAIQNPDMNQVQILVSNGMARVLEKIYGEVMRKADNYFSREEMELVKKQSLELREKKVY